MVKQLIQKIKQILQEHIRFILLFFFLLIVCTYQFPYYIEAPGGTIDISSRVDVKDGYTSTGSFHMAYVRELSATIPTLIVAKLKHDWDIIPKKATIPSNEEESDVYFRDHLLLEEANQIATIVAFKKANKDIEYTNTQLYITYVDEIVNADLKVGDEILKIDGKTVHSKEEMGNLLQSYAIGSTIPFTILRDQKQMIISANMIKYDENRKAIGIMVTEKQEIKTNPEVLFHFKSSESGSSGGLMMTLAIYNALIPEDITHGKKIVGTGTIDKDGNVGTISGIKYKLKGAISQKAEIFFVPNGENYEEAIRLKNENNYKIEVIGVSTFEEAVNYLNHITK